MMAGLDGVVCQMEAMACMQRQTPPTRGCSQGWGGADRAAALVPLFPGLRSSILLSRLLVVTALKHHLLYFSIAVLCYPFQHHCI